MIESRAYGDTGLRVSALGLGAGQLGHDALSEADAAALLAGALDAGVTLLDTAPSYGLSEQRIGRAKAASSPNRMGPQLHAGRQLQVLTNGRRQRRLVPEPLATSPVTRGFLCGSGFSRD